MNVEGGMDGPGFLDPIPEDVSVVATSQYAANLSTVSAVASSDSGGMAAPNVETKKRGRRRKEVPMLERAADMDNDNLSDANASLGGANEHGLEVPLPIPLESKDEDASKAFLWSPNCKRWTLMFLGIVSILAVAVGVGMYIILNRLPGNPQPPSPLEGLTQSPTPNPNFSPFRVSYSTGAPVSAPVYSPEEVTRLNAIFLRVPGTTVVNMVDLKTPQGKAREWIINSDGKMDVNQEQRVQQRYTLCVLHFSTNGDFWTKKANWLKPDKSECEWFGIACNSATNFIRTIDLSENNVIGTLPNEMSSLSNLVALNMSYDEISGTIPRDMFEFLDELETVDLQQNLIVGTVPERLNSIRNSGLRFINLGSNQLTGTFPFFPNIEIISFGKNNLISFDSRYFTSASSVKKFKGFHNKLSGPLPMTWELPNLIELDLGYNFLTGTIPHELWNLPTLKSLFLDHCNVTGMLPSYSESGAMHRLWLDSNSLTGTIPLDFGWNWTKLYSIKLQNNALTGSITAEQCNRWKLNPNLAPTTTDTNSRRRVWTFDADCQIDCACCTNTDCPANVNGRR
mmetsp:Transcript_7624/g.18678  ORF Transcript_7624/g.18678 Transcript_7624/m.18678 type:complete len:568 (-) Transcript_7624:942-2645(-)